MVSRVSSDDKSGLLAPLRATLFALAIVLALFSWLSPNHYFPWTNFHGQLSMAIAAGLIAAWTFTGPSPDANRAPYLALVAIAAAAIPWLQFASGLIFFSGDALMPSLYLLAFGVAQILGYRIVVTYGLSKFLETLAWLFIVGAMLSVSLALHQWLGLDYLFVFALEIARGTRPYANFAQPNLLGTMLVLGLVGCAFVYQRHQIGRMTAALLVAMFAFGIAMTQSRAAYLQLLVVGTWFVLTSRRSRITLRAIMLVAVITVACITAWPYLLDTSDGGGARTIGNSTSAGNRPIHWLSMLDASMRRPWFGYGWNQVSVAHYAVAPDYPATKEALGESHNLILDLLVWNGLPVGLLLTGALGLWFLVMLTRRHSPESAIALAAVLAVFAHSMVEFPIYYLFFMLPVAAMMGGLVAELRPTDSVGLPRWAAPVAVGVLMFVGISLTLEYLRIEAEVLAKRFEQARIGLDTPRMPPLEVKWLTQQGNYLRFAATPESDNMSPAEIEWMGHVAARFPNWTSISRYAAALARNDRPADAAAALNRICRMQTDQQCQLAQARWLQLGEKSTKIAAVPFPVSPSR